MSSQPTLKQRLGNALRALRGFTGPQTSMQEVYIRTAPSPQNAIDIFKGEWACKLPDEAQGVVTGGSVPAFQHLRITWAIEQLGGAAGMNVLELGPLEGGHTYMLDRAGVASVTAIESNTRAYLKCLVVKELLGMPRARFLCGDFVEYLRTCDGKFDFCVASGVLYHMTNPVELLALLARVTDKVYFWTHYYDAEAIRTTPGFCRVFCESAPAEFAGFKHALHKTYYGEQTLADAGFCGGSRPYACWLTRDDLMGALKHLGFTRIDVQFDRRDQAIGPNISLLARKG